MTLSSQGLSTTRTSPIFGKLEIFASVLRPLASPAFARVELAVCDAARPSRCFSEPKERYIEALCASDAVTLLAETVAAAYT